MGQKTMGLRGSCLYKYTEGKFPWCVERAMHVASTMGSGWLPGKYSAGVDRKGYGMISSLLGGAM